MIASKSKYVDAFRRILFDDAKTYRELVGVTTDDVLKRMEDNFKAATTKFQGMQCFKGLFYTLKKWQNNCLLQPHLCPNYPSWRIHKPGLVRLEERPNIPNEGYYTRYTCQQSQFLNCVSAPAVEGRERVRAGPAVEGRERVRVGPAVEGRERVRVGPAVVDRERVRVGPAVFRTDHVLKDAPTLIPRISCMQTGPNLRVATLDATAL